MKKLLDDVSQAIGETPLVDLKRFVNGCRLDGRIIAKLEHLNPGYSKKDRIALRMIEEAEKDGRLLKGQDVIEATSGNTGIGLAIVCLLKGYGFTAVMSKGNSEERIKILKALGAEVVLVEQEKGEAPGRVSGDDLKRVDDLARKIARERGAFFADQFHNVANTHAQEMIGLEIWEQSEGGIDVFLDFAGTGGTFAGCARVLKDKNPRIRCYLAEPLHAAFLSNGEVSNKYHRIQGGGYGIELPLTDEVKIDGYVGVSDDEAMEMVRTLARTEGILSGFSTGANMAAAVKLLQGAEKGSTVALTVNDTGLKYLSAGLFEN